MRIGPFGKDRLVYTMENQNGTRLSVTDAGAAAVSLVYRGTDLLLGWEDPEAYRTNPGCFGATVGRNANRIAGARFSLGGREYALAANDGPNNLHSGPEGWHARRWETVETTENSVTFRMDSPEGDQGFPGRCVVTAGYALTPEDGVILRYRARSDADTILNLTNHAYFNLNGHGAGSAEGHWLRIAADMYTPLGPGLIPTGDVAAVAGTPFDFRAGHPVGRDIGADDRQLRIAGGYDHNFCLAGDGSSPAAELIGDRTMIRLRVYTDRPGLQLYTANALRGEAGKGGAAYPRRGAVCLETQGWPDAVHHGAFPSPILRAGEEFVSDTVWRFSRDGS